MRRYKRDQHYRPRDGAPKRCYDEHEALAEVVRQRGKVQMYLCEVCGFWHLGTVREL